MLAQRAPARQSLRPATRLSPGPRWCTACAWFESRSGVGDRPGDHNYAAPYLQNTGCDLNSASWITRKGGEVENISRFI